MLELGMARRATVHVGGGPAGRVTRVHFWAGYGPLQPTGPGAPAAPPIATPLGTATAVAE